MSKLYSNIRLSSQIIGRAAACLITLFILTVAASAATYTVDTTADNAALSACTAAAGDCSLRGAIARANVTTAEADTITFALPAGSNTITLTGGQIQILNAGGLTIINSAGASNLLISGNNASRIFSVLPNANLTLNAMTITQGRANNGGAINNSGILSLLNSTVSGNAANTSFYGGGIYNNRGNTTLTNSTVSGNSAAYGGGIYNNEGTLNLNSVTVAYNRANSFGGGIYTYSGPIYKATVNLLNTIIANNTAGSYAPDVHGAIAPASSFNLIGNGGYMTGITNGTNGNQVGIDPKLDPALALNGGTTQNHALLAGSPAIDKGSAAGTDQRGFARPVDNQSIANAAGGNGADIGAFEVQPFAPTAANVSVSGRVVTESGRGIRNIVITMTDMHGNVRTATSTSFGYYRFENVAAGETYIFAIRGKRFSFEQNTQVHSIVEEINDINFVADGESILQ